VPPSLLRVVEQAIVLEASTGTVYEFRVLSISLDANRSPIRCTLRKTSLIDQGTVPIYNAIPELQAGHRRRSQRPNLDASLDSQVELSVGNRGNIDIIIRNMESWRSTPLLAVT
jgi:hypothetical protein